MPDNNPRTHEVHRLGATGTRAVRPRSTRRVRGVAGVRGTVAAVLAVALGAGLAGCEADGSWAMDAAGSASSTGQPDNLDPSAAEAPAPESPAPGAEVGAPPEAPGPGAESDGGVPAPPPGNAPSAPPDLVAAARVGLPLLPIKGRAPKTGYDRDQFGQAWSDDVTVAGGHNGCDTRNDVLARDLVDIALKPGSRDCVVLSGTLDDPYTGETVAFTRGSNTSREVQIDHLVALSDAWQKGAQQLGEEQRRNLANDPLNLQAVSGSVNQRKSDGDAATWLPPNAVYRCEYVARQVVVKQEYGLWVTQAEHDAIERELAGCP
ncbi:GmrSD restriction endonuclease domain-containing protein [Dietzia sp.]|uniref:HNH endonuclease family protein n=1 Tax=Dietzia sp. TaxID=1871616 RepID=UPI003FA5586F